MIHFPLVFFWKAGITGKTPGKRARSIDSDMWGFPIPIMFTVIPFGAYRFEQVMKDLWEPFSVDFYDGDGHTEWFFIIGGILILTCVLIVNLMWFLAIAAIHHNFKSIINLLYGV